MYSRNLYAGNPFLIKHHIAEMFNLLKAHQGTVLPQPQLQELANEIEQKLMEMIDRLNPEHYQGYRLMIKGYREILIHTLVSTCFPEDKKDPKALELLSDNAKELLTAAKEVTSDQSLDIYDDSSLVKDFPFGNSIEENLVFIDDMQRFESLTHP